LFVAGALVGNFGREPPSLPASRERHDPPPIGGAASMVRMHETPVACPELDECEQARAFLASQLVVYEGVEQPWPDGIPDAYHATELRALLSTAWQDVGEIQNMDCGEYPCLVTVRLTTGEQSCCPQLETRIPTSLAERHEGGGYFHGHDVAGMHAVLPFGNEHFWTTEIETRTQWRVDRAAEILSDSLAAQDGVAE
jgi:hypothetical protein